MELPEVKIKAKELKETIEDLLRKFRSETGHTPEVEIDTTKTATNSKEFVSQKVSISITI